MAPWTKILDWKHVLLMTAHPNGVNLFGVVHDWDQDGPTWFNIAPDNPKTPQYRSPPIPLWSKGSVAQDTHPSIHIKVQLEACEMDLETRHGKDELGGG